MNFEFVDGRWQMSQEYSPKLRALAAAAWDEGNIALAHSKQGWRPTNTGGRGPSIFQNNFDCLTERPVPI
jgi:hypothetical protein